MGMDVRRRIGRTRSFDVQKWPLLLAADGGRTLSFCRDLPSRSGAGHFRRHRPAKWADGQDLPLGLEGKSRGRRTGGNGDEDTRWARAQENQGTTRLQDADHPLGEFAHIVTRLDPMGHRVLRTNSHQIPGYSSGSTGDPATFARADPGVSVGG